MTRKRNTRERRTERVHVRRPLTQRLFEGLRPQDVEYLRWFAGEGR